MDVAMGVLAEAHRRPVKLDAVLADQFVIGCVSARETDHPPRNHVAVASIDGVAKKALDRALQEMGEKYVGRDASEVLAGCLQAPKIRVLLVPAHLLERSACLRQLGIDSGERGSEQLCRRKGQLVSLIE